MVSRTHNTVHRLDYMFTMRRRVLEFYSFYFYFYLCAVVLFFFWVSSHLVQYICLTISANVFYIKPRKPFCGTFLVTNAKIKHVAINHYKYWPIWMCQKKIKQHRICNLKGQMISSWESLIDRSNNTVYSYPIKLLEWNITPRRFDPLINFFKVLLYTRFSYKKHVYKKCTCSFWINLFFPNYYN